MAFLKGLFNELCHQPPNQRLKIQHIPLNFLSDGHKFSTGQYALNLEYAIEPKRSEAQQLNTITNLYYIIQVI